jgi:6-methylsalicylate decarboxylase
MVIDSHCHWLPGEIIANAHFFGKSWGDIESQLIAMDQAGIACALLSYPTSDAHLKLGGMEETARIYNDNVARIIKAYPGRFIGACILGAGESRRMRAELARATQELGLRAVSLATSYEGVYLDDPVFRGVLKDAERLRLPVFLHPQIVNPIGSERVRDPLLTPVLEYVFDTAMCIGKLLMADVFRELPALNLVCAYFGGLICHMPHRFDATYGMLRQMNFVKDLGAEPREFLKRIYVDTSGDTVTANFLAALDLVGPGHILWGSDWPAKRDIRSSMDAVRSLPIGEREKAGILGENLRSIIGPG